jgi:predicted MFS family arabinose efflux permease
MAGPQPSGDKELYVAVPDKPATYREVFAVAEYRVLFAAGGLSWVGDYFAKVAISVLIFSDTGSVLLAAAGFATSYLPWVAGGPVLAALAERYPYRRVMLACDASRTVLVALMALPGVPLPALLLLLLASSLLTPPFQAARSAMVSQLLTGDRYVIGVSLQNMVFQGAQVAGYAAGGVIAAVDTRAALLVNAATFGASALLLWCGVRPRPSAATGTRRGSLLEETGEGVRLVFGHPVMRPIAIVVFCVVGVAIVPEGLAAAWSAEVGGGSRTTGLLMAAMPIGNVAGTVIVRLTRPDRRLRLIRPMLLACPLLLVPALAGPPSVVVFLLVFAAGVANTVILPLNGLFVQVLPDTFRARAFGVMQGGMQVTHAAAVLATGAVAEYLPVSVVVGLWSLCGLAVTVAALRTWPTREVVDAETARVSPGCTSPTR